MNWLNTGFNTMTATAFQLKLQERNLKNGKGDMIQHIFKNCLNCMCQHSTATFLDFRKLNMLGLIPINLICTIDCPIVFNTYKCLYMSVALSCYSAFNYDQHIYF